MEEHKEFLCRILDEHIKETGSAWAYKIPQRVLTSIAANSGL